MKNVIICTVCPNGCEVTVNYTTKEDAQITGHGCKRGIPYAINECFEPMRTFTSSVKITGSDRRVLPVRTTGPIPRELLMKAAEEVAKITLESPVSCGQVIVENFLDTDVKLISAMSL